MSEAIEPNKEQPLSNEDRERIREGFIIRVNEILNKVGLTVPENRKNSVYVSEDGKISGRIYSLVIPNCQDPVTAENAIALALKESGVEVYMKEDRLIVVQKMDDGFGGYEPTPDRPQLNFPYFEPLGPNTDDRVFYADRLPNDTSFGHGFYYEDGKLYFHQFDERTNRVDKNKTPIEVPEFNLTEEDILARAKPKK